MLACMEVSYQFWWDEMVANICQVLDPRSPRASSLLPSCSPSRMSCTHTQCRRARRLPASERTFHRLLDASTRDTSEWLLKLQGVVF